MRKIILFSAFALALSICNAECGNFVSSGDSEYAANKNEPCQKGYVSVSDYRRSNNDSIDSSPAFQAAIRASNVVYIPAGVYVLSAPIEIPPERDISIFGDGDNSVIKSKGVAILQKDGRTTLGNISLKSFKIVGDFDENRTQLSGANLIELRRGQSLQMENISVEQSRFFGIHATYFNKVVATNIIVRKTARDAMNFSGSQNIRITGGAISEAGDDAIAAHFGDYIKEVSPYDRNIVIDGVDISDSLGIKILGARNVKIVNNNIKWAKGYAIFVGWDWYSKEGFLSQYDLIFSGNTITNWVGLNVFGYPNMDNHAIVLGAYPGRIDSRSDSKREPAIDDFRAKSLDGCLKISRRALIYGNILRRDLYGGISYHVAAGKNAFVDERFFSNPKLPDTFGISDGVAIDVGGCWQDLSVYDNIFEGVGTVIRGMPESKFVLNRIRFERNNIVVSKSPAISMTEGSGRSEGLFISRMNYFRPASSFSSDGAGIFAYSSGNSRLISDGDIFDGCIRPFLNSRTNVVVRNPVFTSSNCPGGGAIGSFPGRFDIVDPDIK